MTRRRAILGVGAAILALALLVGWPRPRASTRAMPGAHAESIGPQAQRSPKPAPPRATTEVSDLPLGDPVPIEELRDDPNRVPGLPLEVTGTVVRSGRPVVGARVRLCRAYPFSDRVSEPLMTPLVEVASSDDGCFALATPRRSRLIVEVRHEGSALRRLLVYMPLAGQPEPLRVELASGRALAVRVVAPDGRGVPGVAVQVSGGGGAAPALGTFPGDSERGFHSNYEVALHSGTAPSVALEAVTDDTGRVRFEGVEPGVVAVEAMGIRETFIVPTGAEIALVREEPGVLEGILKDDQGRIVANADLHVETVGFRNRIGKATGTTDGEGRFRIQEVPPGWVIGGGIDHIGRVEGPPVRVAPSGEARWEPVLLRALDVVGAVFASDGIPCAHARVVLKEVTGWGDQTPVVDSGWAAEDGSFVLRAPSAGKYTVEAAAPGLFGCDEAVVPAGRRTITLRPCARVVGKIQGLTRADRRWATVCLSANGLWCEAHVDAAGRFAFENVPALVNAELHNESAGSSGCFDVPAGSLVRVDLDMPPTCRIVGVVRDEAGRPVANAVVQAPFNRFGFRDMSLVQPASLRTTETDDDGRYELAVRVQKPPWHRTRVIAAHPDYAPSETREFTPPDAGGVAQVDLTLRTGAPLRGHVVEASGAPVRHAAATARPTESHQLPASTYTDADGRFCFPNLVPGAYEIELQADDVWFRRIEAETGPNEVVVRLAQAGIIVGIVVDAQGRPHYDFGLSVHAGGNCVYVGPGGRFRLTELAPGRYDVYAHPIEGEGVVERGVETGTEDLILRLPPD